MHERWFAIAVFIVFASYSLYCVFTESFWQSCRIVFARRWGRQVVADLYVGLLLFSCFVYWHEQSVWKTLAWVAPALVFGNPVTLVYFIWNFDGLASHFR